jgi:hypothetical protein
MRALVAEMKGLGGGKPSGFFYPDELLDEMRSRPARSAVSRAFDYKGWTVMVESWPRGKRWSLYVQLGCKDEGYMQLVPLYFEDPRTFPTQARAHEVGGMLGRAWIALSGRPVAALCREYAQMMKKVRG